MEEIPPNVLIAMAKAELVAAFLKVCVNAVVLASRQRLKSFEFCF